MPCQARPVLEGIALGRLGDPADIAQAVASWPPPGRPITGRPCMSRRHTWPEPAQAGFRILPEGILPRPEDVLQRISPRVALPGRWMVTNRRGMHYNRRFVPEQRLSYAGIEDRVKKIVVEQSVGKMR